MPEGDRHFHLFVYGTLRRNQSAADLLAGCVPLAEVAIEGTLYDLGDYPALLLYGTTPVKGEVWRCPVDLLPALDEYEQMDRGLFRRVGVMAGEYPCWTYVAGPALARQLTPDRRVDGDGWPPPR
jgi:gamma-glutamylcyclotransferase (GGCT)/AIG2-like uncharacterized protein YtfP